MLNLAYHGKFSVTFVNIGNFDDHTTATLNVVSITNFVSYKSLGLIGAYVAYTR